MTKKLPLVGLLLAAPLAAYADTVPHTGTLYAFAGGAVGGFLGALLACWLCHRRMGRKDDGDPKKY